jgi:hypothetical protein
VSETQTFRCVCCGAESRLPKGRSFKTLSRLCPRCFGAFFNRVHRINLKKERHEYGPVEMENGGEPLAS